MVNKKYFNISEVSKMLQIEEHKIRYWDSIDPKTNKYRVDGISTKSKGGTRYFNRENINKLQKLINILYDGKSYNYKIKLADKILSNSKNINHKDKINLDGKKLNNNDRTYNVKKIDQILNKMRLLLKNHDI
tara:strand:+ start:171 stop:566 length:396 start_codon:yes stop_codon:yes gene_type:complete